ncbi:unnamed protein product [Gongylonema pulchrum]|uniref:Uncharacterized protein n=1 Tax=Gongylonema pulchrum TaxID=637853 RepID=A0A183EJD0_9BILA|nr:unnamed protein product [Gongylonema pulchrum]
MADRTDGIQEQQQQQQPSALLVLTQHSETGRTISASQQCHSREASNHPSEYVEQQQRTSTAIFYSFGSGHFEFGRIYFLLLVFSDLFQLVQLKISCWSVVDET